MRKNSNHPHYRCTITLLFNLIITFCLLFPLLVKSQEFAIYNYPSNILPDLETITTIFQDSRGYLWFGGYQGAAYYDGLTFHRFSVQNGLADNYVYTIKESPTGEIWIGTWLGISMYDPVTNIMKRILPYFNDTAVRDIHFTDQGVLIGASGEAYCIQGSGIYTVLQFYDTEGNPEGSPILAIDYDVEDRIAWFATEYFEVVAVDLTRLVKLWEMKDKSIENKYREMESEKFFTIYPQLYDDTVDIYNAELKLDCFVIDDPAERKRIIEETKQVYSNRDGIEKWYVSSLVRSPDNKLYAQAMNGVFIFESNRFLPVDWITQLAGEVEWFDISRDGEFMFSGQKGAFIVSDKDTLRLNDETGFVDHHISSLFYDRQKILWIATRDGDLLKIVDPSLRIYNSKVSPLLKETSAAIKLKDGSILIGGATGLSCFKNNKFYPFHFQPPADDPFLGFSLDKNQDIILVTLKSIFLIQGRRVVPLIKDLDILYEKVSFLLDYRNVLWIITGKQVFTWDGLHLTPQPKLVDDLYLTIFTYLSPDSSLFFGTWRALYQMKNDTLWKYTSGSVFSMNLNDPKPVMNYIGGFPPVRDHVVTCGIYGTDSTYWFGAFGGGLVCLKDHKFFNPFSEQNFISHRFYRAYMTEDSTINFLGSRGIVTLRGNKIQLLQLESDVDYKFLDLDVHDDGTLLIITSRGLIVQNNRFHAVIDQLYGLNARPLRSILQVEGDRYLLIQDHGFISLDINRLMESDSLFFPVAIRNLRAGVKDVALQNPVHLKRDQRDLCLYFSMNDFLSEQRNKFSWYLEGLENDYREFTLHHEAHYHRLPAGHYRFHLKAVNSRGVEVSLASPLVIEIPPFFRETIFFKLILVLAGLALIYLVVFWRMRQIRRTNIILEAKVRERTRELQEALQNIKTLSGLIPICASCKKIRNDKGFWQQVENYVAEHSYAEFSHGICPDCIEKYYKDLSKKESITGENKIKDEAT